MRYAEQNKQNFTGIDGYKACNVLRHYGYFKDRQTILLGHSWLFSIYGCGASSQAMREDITYAYDMYVFSNCLRSRSAINGNRRPLMYAEHA